MRTATLILVCLFTTAGIGITDELPLFDAHIHYNERSWSALSPSEAAATLRKAGVQGALVSSTPNDGTLKLQQAAPNLVIPFLSPYRDFGDMSSWHSDPEIVELLERKMKSGNYHGIGEFHLNAGDVDDPAVRLSAELARKHDAFLLAHTDAAGIEALARTYPQVRFLWAHAGLSTGAERVGRVVSQHEHVWVELSLRTPEIGTPDAADRSADSENGRQMNEHWRAVLTRFPDRFLIGTDPWITSRWRSLEKHIAATREWLRLLPDDVARRIAYENGESLFGGG